MILHSSKNKGLDAALGALFHDDRRPHAILIEGGSESEREKAALFVSKLFVCSGERKPCDMCEACRKAEAGIHPDVIAVTRPDDKKFFAKEAVKSVVENAVLTPNEAETKVFVIHDMQWMTPESQNVLLKILEEPPSFTAFVLTAEMIGSVIPTVQSRVVSLHLEQGSSETQYDEKALAVTGEIAKALFSSYEYDLLAAAAPLDGNKNLTAAVLPLVLLFFRDALVRCEGGKPILTALSDESAKAASFFGEEALLKKYDCVAEFYASLTANPNYTLLSALLPARLKQ